MEITDIKENIIWKLLDIIMKDVEIEDYPHHLVLQSLLSNTLYIVFDENRKFTRISYKLTILINRYIPLSYEFVLSPYVGRWSENKLKELL